LYIFAALLATLYNFSPLSVTLSNVGSFHLNKKKTSRSLAFYILISGMPTKLLKTSALDDSCNTGPQQIRGFKCPVTYRTSIPLLAHNISLFFTPQQSPVIFQYKKQRK
jgi:hypothetical protein